MRATQAGGLVKTWLFACLLLLLCHFAPAAIITNIVTTTADSGAGSLRQAIINANTNTDPTVSNLIVFKLTGTAPFTLTPGLGGYPSINTVVTIDGTTQTNYAGTPKIYINGTNAGNGDIDGFDLESSNCVIRGLAIGHFAGDGIHLGTGGGYVIQANFIGTTTYGTNAAPNGWGGSDWSGIGVQSCSNLIGGTSSRAIISART
jgi:hypothetical protein